MGLAGLMRKLKIEAADAQKVWFFKVNSFMRNDNLRMYSMSLEVVKKNVETGNLMKLPDPRDFVIGVNAVLERGRVSRRKTREVGHVNSGIG